MFIVNRLQSWLDLYLHWHLTLVKIRAYVRTIA